MGILAQDTFIRPDDPTGWNIASDGKTWTAPRGAGAYSIVSDEGINSSNGGTFSVARIGSGTAADQQIQTRVKPADTTSAIGCVARFVDMDNFYYGIFNNGQLQIGKDISNTFTTLNFVAFSYSTSNFYQMILSVIGTNLSLKVWQDGTSEPASWTVTATDSSIASGGYGLGSDATGSTSFDNLTVTDGQTLVSLTTLTEDTFKIRVPLGADARGIFKIRTVLMTQSRDRFTIRAVLGTKVREIFFIRAVLVSFAREHFSICAILGSQARASWQIRSMLMASVRASWTIRAVFQAGTRAIWNIRAVLESLTRATFKIQNVFVMLGTWVQATFKIRAVVIPTTPVTASGRDGVVIARGRDGQVLASSRDGRVEARGR